MTDLLRSGQTAGAPAVTFAPPAGGGGGGGVNFGNLSGTHQLIRGNVATNEIEETLIDVDDAGNLLMPALAAGGPSARLSFQYADVYIEQPSATASHFLMLKAAGGMTVETPNTTFQSASGTKDCQIGAGSGGNNYVTIDGNTSPDPPQILSSGIGGGDTGFDLAMVSTDIGRICAKNTAEAGVGAIGIAAFRERYAVITRAGLHGVATTKGDILARDVDKLIRLAVGTIDGQVLTVDSTTATGLKWAAGGGGASNSFTTIDCPAGTDPVADTATDTLQLLAPSGRITITGDAAGDSVTFDVVQSAIDHGSIGGLGDVADHLGYYVLDGSRPLTGDVDIGAALRAFKFGAATIFSFAGAVSDVNYVALSSAAMTASPGFAALGTDTDIGISFIAKGAKGFDLFNVSTTNVTTTIRNLGAGVHNLDVDGSILVGGTVDGVDVAAHAARHASGGGDAVDHDGLTNFVADEHVAHSGVAFTAGVGLSGGGTLAANRTFDLDITELTAESTLDGAADYVAVYDASATAHRKALLNDLVAGILHVKINDRTANYTLVIGDDGKLVRVDNSGPNTLTVPPNSSVAFPVGTSIGGQQVGAGQTTITPGSGVTLHSLSSHLKSAGQYARWLMTKVATDTWSVCGELAA